MYRCSENVILNVTDKYKMNSDSQIFMAYQNRLPAKLAMSIS